MGRKRTLEGAVALAVDTLDLVGTDDDVLEGGTVLELEDGVLVATFGLASALDTTAVGLEATVEGALDGLGGLVGDGALGSGDVEAEAALNDLGSRGSRGADGESAETSSARKTRKGMRVADSPWCTRASRRQPNSNGSSGVLGVSACSAAMAALSSGVSGATGSSSKVARPPCSSEIAKLRSCHSSKRRSGVSTPETSWPPTIIVTPYSLPRSSTDSR